MKRTLIAILVVVLLLCVAPFGAVKAEADSHTERTEGYYTYVVQNGKAMITEVDEQISGAVVIPSKLGGYEVATIDSYAFDTCRQITKVTIPNSVKIIDAFAFSYCSNLKTVALGNEVEKIGDWAFLDCSELTSVTFGPKLTEIGTQAFAGCSNLANITFPKSLDSIGQYAFQSCISLVRAIIPEGVEVIGAGAFANCKGMTEISIPDTITYIGDSAFAGCSNLPLKVYEKGLYLGNSSNPYVVYISPQYDFMSSLNIHKDTKIIYSGAFANESSIREITIPNGVRCIGDYAFHYNIYLENIKLPDSLIYVGYESFKGCENLESIVLPNSVKSIDASAFSGCISLESVTLGDNLEFIGWYAFEACIALKSIKIPDSMISIGDWVFADCTSLSSVTIGTGIKQIGDKAFIRCESLKSIQIPYGVTEIGEYAFHECFALTDIYLPNTVTKIGGYAFRYCSSLTSITIPQGVEKLEMNTFADCPNLKSIVLPASLSEVSYYAFNGCNSLQTVYYTGSSAQWSQIDVMDENAPLQNASLHTNYVPVSFSKHPGSQNVKAGATVKFSVATNASASYQWQCRTATGTWKDIAKATGAQYSIVTKGAHNGYRFRCKVTDQKGIAYYSNEAKLHVLAVDVRIVSAKVPEGKTASVTVKATGDGLTYTWYHKNASASAYAKSSVTGTTYSTKMTSSSNGRYVYCVVRDKYGNTVQTNKVRLWRIIPVKLTSSLKNGYAAEGKMASVTVKATGTGLTYTWYHKNASASAYAKSSVTGATYSTKITSSSNGRYVYCVVRDQYGNTVQTNKVRLWRIIPVKLTSSLKNGYAAEGKMASVTVRATGDGLTYTWYHKNANAAAYAKSSVTGATYSTKITSSSNGRYVYCVVRDRYGNTVQTNKVRLWRITPVKITTQPVSPTVANGSTASVTVKATGDGLTYTWYHKSATASAYAKSSATGATYSVKMAAATKGRMVYCVVKDKYGNAVKSNVVTLKMK